MKEGIISYLLLPVLCLLLFVSCSLFNNIEETDIEKKMDEAIAWAKAPKLTVQLAFPSKWGFSNPQQGTLTSVSWR